MQGTQQEYILILLVGAFNGAVSETSCRSQPLCCHISTCFSAKGKVIALISVTKAVQANETQTEIAGSLGLLMDRKIDGYYRIKASVLVTPGMV